MIFIGHVILICRNYCFDKISTFDASINNLFHTYQKSNNRVFHCKNIYFDEQSGENDREAATITIRYNCFFFDNKCGGPSKRFLLFPLIKSRIKSWFCCIFGSGMVPSPTPPLCGSSPTFPLYRSLHAGSE